MRRFGREERGKRMKRKRKLERRKGWKSSENGKLYNLTAMEKIFPASWKRTSKLQKKIFPACWKRTILQHQTNNQDNELRIG